MKLVYDVVHPHERDPEAIEIRSFSSYSDASDFANRTCGLLVFVCFFAPGVMDIDLGKKWDRRKR